MVAVVDDDVVAVVVEDAAAVVEGIVALLGDLLLSDSSDAMACLEITKFTVESSEKLFKRVTTSD